ncbi:MAG: DUF2231 domain-containing protein [Actinophytocola sp.]|uniref:DUF2231 domain-containing protein n=1 Tax=Actinophytocola sp. TaxID=1872138 RepID=UPI0013209771|nr:DUF2231 domain-containing protein [Actinophytocola sp.]MPZ86433.1 DUF2231 domain-containing protein [Actinophytocola sp.]
MNVRSILRAAESASVVDRPAGVVAGVVRRVLGRSWLDKVLRGSWLGHPVHPLLVAVPIGAWLSAALFDYAGERRPARQLVALGLAATPPTVLVGLADFGELNAEQRRVGLLHASANLVSTGFFLNSYLCRLRRRHTAGVVWSSFGLLALGVGGALGGHLSYAQGAGVHRWTVQEAP